MDPLTREQERAEFAIKCRTVRLAIGKNRGLTEFQLTKLVGFDTEKCLDKLLQMELVAPIDETKYPTKWEIIHK